MLGEHQSEDTIYDNLKMSPKKRRHKRRSEIDLYEVLKPWEDDDDNFQGYLIRKRLFPDKPAKKRLFRAPSINSFVVHHEHHDHHEPIMQLSEAGTPLKEKREDFHLPSLVSLDLPKDKKERQADHPAHHQQETKRSCSLPLLHRPKKTLFQQKRSLGMGDLRQQKIKQLKDCISSQILCRDDFQSLKSKILKI